MKFLEQILEPKHRLRVEKGKIALFQTFSTDFIVHRKKLASIMAANKVFVVVTKSTGTASTVSASAKLATKVAANVIVPSVAE
jgi:hypothetical protein